MTLTRVERWMLANQFKILEKLYPDEAKYYQNAQKVVQSGYEGEYGELALAQDVNSDDQCLSADECHEVIDILAMFDHLRWSYEALTDKSDIDPSDIAFPGFDGNNEPRQLGYCQHFCDERPDGRRFTGLDRGHDHFNSHAGFLDLYRQMLPVWKEMPRAKALSEEQILTILQAFPHADSPTGKLRDVKPEGSIQ